VEYRPGGERKVTCDRFEVKIANALERVELEVLVGFGCTSCVNELKLMHLGCVYFKVKADS
jgi:hypothetical protein